MPEREPQTFLNKLNENFKAVGRRVAYPASAGILAIAAACFGGDDSKVDDQTTVTPQKTRVERTFTPSTSPTEEATLVVTVLPTPEPTLEPTTVYVSPLVTPRPIQTPASVPTPRPTPVSTSTPEPSRPTLTPTLTPTQRATPTGTPTPQPTLLPTPVPTYSPLEVCNSGRFLRPVDGQEIPTHVDVRVELANNENWDEGCTGPNQGSVDADVRLIDTFGNKFDWDLYCLSAIPFHPLDRSACWRDGVILADFPGRRWGMEIELNGQIVEHISVTIR